MSGQPGDNRDEENDQPRGRQGGSGGGGGGRPQGGQPQGQPQGGQPQGQPQGGQPQGQPQGGQPQGSPQGPPGGPPGGAQAPGGHHEPQDTGPGIGDIFNRDDTMDQMKMGVAVFAVVGVGVLLSTVLGDVLLGDSAFDDFGFGAALFIGMPLFGTIVAGPLIGVFLARIQSEALPTLDDNLVFGTVAVTAAGGVFVLQILGWLGATIAADNGPALGDTIMVAIAVVIGSAVAAVAAVAAMRNL